MRYVLALSLFLASASAFAQSWDGPGSQSPTEKCWRAPDGGVDCARLKNSIGLGAAWDLRHAGLADGGSSTHNYEPGVSIEARYNSR
jgi:hypothetical protein